MLSRSVYFEAGWKKYNMIQIQLLLLSSPLLFHIIPEFLSISQTFCSLLCLSLVVICLFAVSLFGTNIVRD